MGRYSLDAYEAYPTLTVRPDAVDVLPPGMADAQLPIVSLWDDAGLDAMGSGTPYALMLPLKEHSLLDTAQRLAERGLQRHWQRMPVRAALDGVADEDTLDALKRWHVCAADQPLGLGPRITLRRATCPRTNSSGGAFPLRLWWCNTGTSPLYAAARHTLTLTGEVATASIPLQADPHLFRKLGDIVHNEILVLSALPKGIYALSLQTHIGAAHGPSLPLGRVQVDDVPRPERFRAWEGYYPEGYYPLEDPKEPVAEQDPPVADDRHL